MPLPPIAISRSADAFLTRCGGSSLHGREPRGIAVSKLCKHYAVKPLSPEPTPPGSLPWRELPASGGVRMGSAERLTALRDKQ